VVGAEAMGVGPPSERLKLSPICEKGIIGNVNNEFVMGKGREERERGRGIEIIDTAG